MPFDLSVTQAALQVNPNRFSSVEPRRLEALSPLSVLRRGYAVVTRQDDGKVVLTATQAPGGADLDVRLAEGKLKVRVMDHN